MYGRLTQDRVGSSNRPDAGDSEYRRKAVAGVVLGENPYTLTLFMTTSPCVISVGAARETLSEGKADYCMIVCE